MPKLKFVLAVDGVNLDDEDQIEDLMEVLPNVHWQQVGGQVQAIVLLDGQDAPEEARHVAAVVSQTVPGAAVVDVVEDLVSISDIAVRSGFTRQYVRMLTTAERGPGGFPRALGMVGKTQVWTWAVVSDWLQEHFELGDAFQLPGREELHEIRRAVQNAVPTRVVSGPQASRSRVITAKRRSGVIPMEAWRQARPGASPAFQTAAEARGWYDANSAQSATTGANVSLVS